MGPPPLCVSLFLPQELRRIFVEKPFPPQDCRQKTILTGGFLFERASPCRIPGRGSVEGREKKKEQEGKGANIGRPRIPGANRSSLQTATRHSVWGSGFVGQRMHFLRLGAWIYFLVDFSLPARVPQQHATRCASEASKQFKPAGRQPRNTSCPTLEVSEVSGTGFQQRCAEIERCAAESHATNKKRQRSTTLKPNEEKLGQQPCRFAPMMGLWVTNTTTQFNIGEREIVCCKSSANSVGTRLFPDMLDISQYVTRQTKR